MESTRSSYIYTAILVVVLLLIAGGFWYYFADPGVSPSSTTSLEDENRIMTDQDDTSLNSAAESTDSTVTTVTTEADLEASLRELEATDLDSIDSALTENETDSSGF